MGKVLLIWAVQIGVVIYFAFSAADVSGFMERVRSVFQSKRVWALFAGCIAFLWASASAAQQLDISGAFLGSLSFYVEAALLLAAIGAILFRRMLGARGIDLTFGSAKFATPAHASARGLLGETGIRLGFLMDTEPGNANSGPQDHALHYTGERHLLTVAPTRAGKGVSVIIPNLLTRQASAIVIDPKGENAAITYDQRLKFGKAFALDPWGITGKPCARYSFGRSYQSEPVKDRPEHAQAACSTAASPVNMGATI